MKEKEIKPKEKAQELFEGFEDKLYDLECTGLGDTDTMRITDESRKRIAKQCALIAVEEILNSHDKSKYDLKQYADKLVYYQKVKEEIANNNF